MSATRGEVKARPPEVEIFEDIEAMSRAAAVRFAGASVEAITTKKEFTVAISGGSTPKNLYLLLGSGYYARAIDWQHVHLFWADERCVPPDHEQSNFKLALDTFLSKVPLPPGNVHRIKGEEPPDFAADEYEAALREIFGKPGLPAFDLILLGLGEDGHTASLFPGSPSLIERERLAVAVRKDPPELNRVTLTLPVLNNAHRVIFLVSGDAKAHVLQEILTSEERRPRYPAELVSPASGKLTWLTDKSTARLIRHSHS